MLEKLLLKSHPITPSLGFRTRLLARIDERLPAGGWNWLTWTLAATTVALGWAVGFWLNVPSINVLHAPTATETSLATFSSAYPADSIESWVVQTTWGGQQ